eukprot:COSAG02_NODE_31717_length_528_cov_1.557110_1_plen_101_part_10
MAVERWDGDVHNHGGQRGYNPVDHRAVQLALQAQAMAMAEAMEKLQTNLYDTASESRQPMTTPGKVDTVPLAEIDVVLESSTPAVAPTTASTVVSNASVGA